jgi:hypothetical protein
MMSFFKNFFKKKPVEQPLVIQIDPNAIQIEFYMVAYTKDNSAGFFFSRADNPDEIVDKALYFNPGVTIQKISRIPFVPLIDSINYRIIIPQEYEEFEV